MNNNKKVLHCLLLKQIRNHAMCDEYTHSQGKMTENNRIT